MTTSVDRQQLLAYLDILNARLSAVGDVKTRIQEFRSKEQHESSSVALPFRGTSGVLGAGDVKMLRAVDAYADQTQQVRDSLKNFLDSTAGIDDEHGEQVSEEGRNEQVWTI
ncbi:hypothetical protein H7J87_11865 [Mycolicibacterium wolinskyi]|uniref:Uncharacterized protein n=1 Tax=Mycolicibacterium wolinskyi TaxID=59750 RepID=A0A1X2FJ35_9MYCO|nr:MULTISPECIES: hypothetical protein [Mycolicibacterium]MCV7286027.1 hypothetical protein [Mycolicibacterium wolinskyi]MCV7296223.1 hypothetical protein [Mycolicibacterium goodii]ORX18455.1 hypothetical protein AWC31_14220 [Mycolicibacterium wolinskyi]